MIVIGLTGGIASGKSTVAAELRRLGLPVFDADEASRQAVAAGSEGLKLVQQTFGSEYLTPTGELNREKVAALVFRDKEALKKLEAIIHKIVLSEVECFLQECRSQGCQAAVLDVPLLIECGWHEKVDVVWLVAVSIEEQIKRAMLRSGMPEADVKRRIAAQMSLEEKKAYAGVVFDNSGELENTLSVVRKEVKKILGEDFGR
jgi:dephospho-CoA kinase